MKKLVILMIGIAFLAGNVNAQTTTSEITKERKEIVKASSSELNKKVNKASKKEAKKLTKEGWLTTPGALPLEKQLDKSYTMQYQYDNDLFPKYVMGEAMSIGENYDAASITQSVSAGKNLITQSIGRIIPVVEVYREKDNKNKEVLVRIAYNSDMARKAAKEAIRKDLEERGDALHEKLDELLGW